ncbi:LytR/AlgR family response regulator transcription factor [Peribacillus sp. NPDC056705]|uniref:LytR/AlgR family response regulator transcription factor n=1 Tax=Peribacillus sp. NPDC056705 TaxID=3345918 RepID=UPI0037486FC2
MKAIVIDDENPALMQMQRLIHRDGRLEIAGAYTQAQDALDQWASCEADIVFLDIEMPGMNGLEAGKRLQQLDPDVHIVYVTAYNDHILASVHEGDVDLLKPVDPQRFQQTVTVLQRRIAHKKPN